MGRLIAGVTCVSFVTRGARAFSSWTKLASDDSTIFSLASAAGVAGKSPRFRRWTERTADASACGLLRARRYVWSVASSSASKPQFARLERAPSLGLSAPGVFPRAPRFTGALMRRRCCSSYQRPKGARSRSLVDAVSLAPSRAHSHAVPVCALRPF